MERKKRAWLLKEQERLQKQLDEITAQLGDNTRKSNWNGFSFRQRKVKCGKSGCKKCASGERHGSYWYAYRHEGGKTKSYYVGKDIEAWKAKNSERFFIDSKEVSIEKEPEIKTIPSKSIYHSPKVRECLKRLESIKHVYVDRDSWKKQLMRPLNLAGARLDVLSYEALEGGRVMVTVQRKKGSQKVELSVSWLFYKHQGSLCPVWV